MQKCKFFKETKDTEDIYSNFLSLPMNSTDLGRLATELTYCVILNHRKADWIHNVVGYGNSYILLCASQIPL